jgi:hypothetical protein
VKDKLLTIAAKITSTPFVVVMRAAKLQTIPREKLFELEAKAYAYDQYQKHPIRESALYNYKKAYDDARLNVDASEMTP